MDPNFEEKRKELIEHLKSRGYLKTPKIIQALETIPRELFVRERDKNYAYQDRPLPIGHGQTISAVHMSAIMTEKLRPKKTDKVLEIGAGSGYQAAILSRLVSKVITVEIQPELADFARQNLKKAGIENAQVVQGDGSQGYPKEAPYEKILLTCGAPEIPKPLKKQLKEGGTIVAPIGGRYHQTLIIGTKKEGKLETKNYGGVRFVPLRGSKEE